MPTCWLRAERMVSLGFIWSEVLATKFTKPIPTGEHRLGTGSFCAKALHYYRAAADALAATSNAATSPALLRT